jgi:hypothetical protein
MVLYIQIKGNNLIDKNNQNKKIKTRNNQNKKQPKNNYHSKSSSGK